MKRHPNLTKSFARPSAAPDEAPLDPSVTKPIQFYLCVVAAVYCLLLGLNSLHGQETHVLPEPVTSENFEALKTNSPFNRSVGLSSSLVLTGMARIEGNVFATLIDLDTRESHLVSRAANTKGMQLVDMKGDESDLEAMTAKIQIPGGEVVSIRYEKVPTVKAGTPGRTRGSSAPQPTTAAHLKEAKDAAVNYKKGFSSDGFPDAPPKEIIEKLSKMNNTQRESINRQMIELRNRGMGMDERRKIYVDKVNQTASGRR